jgi:hypothetical protein
VCAVLSFISADIPLPILEPEACDYCHSIVSVRVLAGKTSVVSIPCVTLNFFKFILFISFCLILHKLAAKLSPNNVNRTKQKSARSKPLLRDNFALIGHELIEMFRKS